MRLLITLLFICSSNLISYAQKKEHFGAKIIDKGAIDLNQMDSNIEMGDTLHVKLTAVVSSVCKNKGCWMRLAASNSDREIFVRFKDYGFFVPMDCDGRTAIVEGKLFVHLTPVEELKHYAEDQGKSQEEIDKINSPELELQMIADGVILLQN